MKRDRTELREGYEDDGADSVVQYSELHQTLEQRMTMIIQEIIHKRANLTRFVQEEDASSGVADSDIEGLLFLDSKPGAKIPKSPSEAVQLFESVAGNLTTKRRYRKNWSMAEMGLLFWVLLRVQSLRGRTVLEMGPDEWEFVGGMIPGRNGEKCMFKWLTYRKFELCAYPWTECEDNTLKRLLGGEGRVNWLEISQVIYLENTGADKAYRSGKQCRERWTSHLEPGLKKGFWELEEDLEIMELFKRMGKKWFQMSKLMQNRSENSIKNRFNLLIQKFERREGEDEDKVVQRIITDLHKKMAKGRRLDQRKTEFIEPRRDQSCTGHFQPEPEKGYQAREHSKVAEGGGQAGESVQKAESLIRDIRDSQLWVSSQAGGAGGTLSEQFSDLELICEGVTSMSLESVPREVLVQKLDLLEISSLNDSLMECVLDLDSLVIYHSHFRVERERTNSIVSALSLIHSEQRRQSKRSETVAFPRLLIYPNKRQTIFNLEAQNQRRNTIFSERIAESSSQIDNDEQYHKETFPDD